MLSVSNRHDIRCRLFRCRLAVCTCLCYWHHHCILHLWGLSAQGAFLLQFFDGVWAVLNKDHSVVGFQPAPQLDVNLTLHVHEDQASCESNGHHDEFGPKWPFEDTFETETLCYTLNVKHWVSVMYIEKKPLAKNAQVCTRYWSSCGSRKVPISISYSMGRPRNCLWNRKLLPPFNWFDHHLVK